MHDVALGPHRGTWRALLAGALLVVASGVARADFLYVNNNAAANSVSAFSVNAGSGALTAVPGSPFATGGAGGFTADIDSIAICGDVLYASNGNGSSAMAFLINETSGALTPVLGSPFATGSCPTGLACTPANDRLYVGNFCSDSLSIFDVNPTTGALSPNAASLYLPARTNCSTSSSVRRARACSSPRTSATTSVSTTSARAVP
ncbi:MAG: beta-propeller fold lactonase family protein [Candidatus Binatia bacterium]